ncbi:hypothetical protein THAOC_14560, partial [Thalassiosira oceanica]
DECELDILIDMMEMDVALNHNLFGQWTRAAFHDAGTFNQITNEGGANGCLMNFPPMRLEPENNFLNAPLNHLEAIKNNWHSHPDTCIDVSSADMLQFAMFFVVVRQSNLIEPLNLGTPNVIAKRNLLKTGFAWGRPDECDTMWVDNLPGFHPSNDGNIAGPTGRCAAAGGEIKTKMMDRNGFTAEEATVLIGAHTIGLVRNTFGTGSFAGPWVTDGADNATPDGPVFNNKYHDFLINTIVANDASQFAAASPGIVPFTMQFPDWFRDVPNDLDHLDTDIALAFPSENLGMHPDFSVHSAAFAGSNAFFLSKFMAAMDKMGKLGVSVALQPASTPCSCSSRRRLQDRNDFGKSFISLNDALVLARDLGNATSWALMQNLDTQQGRIEEIQKLTTPERVIDPPQDTGLFVVTIPQYLARSRYLGCRDSTLCTDSHQVSVSKIEKDRTPFHGIRMRHRLTYANGDLDDLLACPSPFASSCPTLGPAFSVDLSSATAAHTLNPAVRGLGVVDNVTGATPLKTGSY